MPAMPGWLPTSKLTIRSYGESFTLSNVCSNDSEFWSSRGFNKLARYLATPYGGDPVIFTKGCARHPTLSLWGAHMA